MRPRCNRTFVGRPSKTSLHRPSSSFPLFRPASQAVPPHSAPVSTCLDVRKHRSPLLSCRSFSTNTPSHASLADFFRSPLTPAQARQAGIQNAYQHWLSSLESKNPKKIQDSYWSLQRWLEELAKYDQPVHAPLAFPKVEELQAALAILSECAITGGDIEVMKSMYLNSKDLLDKSGQMDHHQHIIKALAVTSRSQEAIKYLKETVELYNTSPQLSFWEGVMDGFSVVQDAAGLRDAVAILRPKMKPMTTAFYAACLQRMFKIPGSTTQDIDRITENMRQDGIENDVQIHTTLLRGCLQKGWTARVLSQSQAAEEYAKSHSVPPSDPSNQEFWDTLILHRTTTFSSKACMLLVENLCSNGFRPLTSTLNAYCRGMNSSGRGISLLEMKDIEKRWEVKADRETWEILISSALDDGGLSKAFEIYEESRAHIEPNLRMVDRLIAELCSPAAGRVLPDHFQAAMEIYQEVVAEEAMSEVHSVDTRNRLERMYLNLLRASAGSPDETVFTLLSHMRDRSITLKDTSAFVPLLTDLMRQSSSYTQAFKIYTRIRELEPALFDSDTFTAVLTIFSSLSFRPPGRRFPPQDLYFRIIGDMAAAGYPPGEDLYILLFRQYRASILTLKTSAREELGDPNTLLKRDFTRAYNLLRLDPLITPSLHLLNIIMDAFGRFGEFEQGHRVWKEQLCSPPMMFDARSVCIVLDMCGYHGDRITAQEIWRTIRDRLDHDPTFELNRNCWMSWIECLGRLGCHNEARRVVMVELGSPESRGGPIREGVRGYERRPFADKGMLSLLRDFTPKNQKALLTKQIEQYLPHLSLS